MAEEALLYQLVIVGSSAGGIEALSTLLSTLPSDFPAPIVIAQHLAPERLSHLAGILQRRSTLPVHTITDHEELAPGNVFVVPADRHVEIVGHTVNLHADGRGRPKPSVNLLFSSAAHAYGERLVAVILTGAGSDGAEGARDVKQAGGTVLSQNPGTALYPSMPESLDPTTVDIVADLERIGPLLRDLLTGVYAPTRPAEIKTLHSFLEEVRERSGIDFTSYKMPTITRRLQRRIAATGTENLADYLRYLRTHPEEYQRLISTFLIKVTEFFRDPELFGYLREHILPELIENARQHGNELRLWSAGCATGEEAYSLAILVAELLGEELDQFNVRIFATDLDDDAIAFARHGVYLPSALANLPEEMINRYFSRIDGQYAIKKRVRALMVFGKHDLGQRAPFPRIDLALCRNVLIYFTADLQKRALQLFAYSLRDGGYLVLGKAETTNPLTEFFTPVSPSLKIYRRYGDRMLIPVARIKDTSPLLPAQSLPNRRLPMNLDLARSARATTQLRTSNARLGDLVLGLPVGVVVVDRHYDIQTINSAAHRLLGIHRAAIGEDLVHLAEGVPSKTLRATIDAAFRGASASGAGEAVTIETPMGERRYLEIVGYPQQLATEDEPIDCAVILITDVTDSVRQRLAAEESYQHELQTLESTNTQQQEELAHHSAQMQRLADINRELFEANEELTTANMELRSANEEFLVNSEEVQAASEEVETLNEELQATNEELETLNEELNTTNDDLQARSVELQELAGSLEEQRRVSEAERVRLATILATIGDAVLVVDAAGKLMLTNAAYMRMFGEGAFVPEDETGQPLPPDATPQQRAARGESFNMQFTLTAADGSRRWFEANGQPSASEDTTAGVVVIRDITERSLRRLQDQFLALASHELRTPLTTIQGSLQMLVRALSTSEVNEQRLSRYASNALRQTRRLERLVGDLVDVSRLQSGKLSLQMQRFDLAQLVRQTTEAEREEGRPAIRLTIADEPLIVNGDATRVEQVLQNLLNNAAKYARNSEHIDVDLRRAGDDAELRVRDYGAGIPASDIPRLFMRFYQVARNDRTAQSGLGLGLFIANELIAAHGGSISVKSTVGEGSTFTVRLPLSRD